MMIHPNEIADLLVDAAHGFELIELTGPSWNDVYAGNVGFKIGCYEVIIFNDCDELDYVEEVRCDDGREADFDWWWDHFNRRDPVCYLTRTEWVKVKKMLEAA